MSKRIILLALVAASAAIFVLPAASMAVEEDVPIHVVPKPEGIQIGDGEGTATLTGGFGAVACTASKGSGEATTTTTGTGEGTFTGCTLGSSSCTTPGQAAGTITTEKLEAHLVTVEDTTTHATGPGVLLTPNAQTGQFATFTCGFLNFTLKGNGVIGTITKPKCGESSTEATVAFSSSSTGVQTHKTVVGTKTEYSLELGGAAASLDASGVNTLGKLAKLECT
jgi:hypothetical protein